MLVPSDFGLLKIIKFSPVTTRKIIPVSISHKDKRTVELIEALIFVIEILLKSHIISFSYLLNTN